MTTTRVPLEPGCRVMILRSDGTPTGSGTVTTYCDRDNPHAVVHVDGRNADVEHCFQRESIRSVGCERCDETGFVAERREGITYPTPCADCNSDARDGRYWWDAEEYCLTHSE